MIWSPLKAHVCTITLQGASGQGESGDGFPAGVACAPCGKRGQCPSGSPVGSLARTYRMPYISLGSLAQTP